MSPFLIRPSLRTGAPSPRGKVLGVAFPHRFRRNRGIVPCGRPRGSPAQNLPMFLPEPMWERTDHRPSVSLRTSAHTGVAIRTQRPQAIGIGWRCFLGYGFPRSLRSLGMTEGFGTRLRIRRNQCGNATPNTFPPGEAKSVAAPRGDREGRPYGHNRKWGGNRGVIPAVNIP